MEKQQQLYSENGEKCTQGSGGERTYRRIWKSHAQVTNPNEIPTQSRRSQFSLDNPEIHSCYWKSTSESILANRYGTRRSCNGLVVGSATTYTRGMTVPESKPTLLPAITLPGVLRGSSFERTYQQRITAGD